MADLKIHSVDSGFCRVYYVFKNSAGETVLYCLQNDGREGVNFYSCTQSIGEPSHIVKPDPLKVEFERPKIECSLTEAVNKWIDDFEARRAAILEEVSKAVEKFGEDELEKKDN